MIWNLFGFWYMGLAFILYVVQMVGRWVWSSFVKPIDLKAYKRGQGWAVITGATDGIGLGFAHVIARQGFNILLVSRSKEKLEDVKNTIQKAYKVQVDYVVSNANDVSATNIDSVVQKCKGRDLSILVNNVGIGQGGIKPLELLSADTIQQAITVNCTYPTLLTHALLPQIKSQSRGRRLIINISSLAAVLMNPFSSVYAATKGFNRQFSLALTAELCWEGVDVLCVNPGFVESNMTKMKAGPMCCTAIECAESALRKIGEIEAIPHWKHMIMYLVSCIQHFVPKSLRPAIVYKIVSSVRRMTGRFMKTE